MSRAGLGVATHTWLSRARALASSSQWAGPGGGIFWRPSEHLLLTCGHVESPGVDQQFAAHLLGVDLGELSEPDVIADAQADLAPGGGERGEVVAGAQGVRLLEGHLAGDILGGIVSTGHG